MLELMCSSTILTPVLKLIPSIGVKNVILFHVINILEDIHLRPKLVVSRY
jgi:hypothetical protein